MAIDTNEKLLSMLNFGDGTTLHVLWEADAVVNADDRLHLLDLYSGIAASGVISYVAVTESTKATQALVLIAEVSQAPTIVSEATQTRTDVL